MGPVTVVLTDDTEVCRSGTYDKYLQLQTEVDKLKMQLAETQRNADRFTDEFSVMKRQHAELEADLAAERKKNNGYEIIIDHATHCAGEDAQEKRELRGRLANLQQENTWLKCEKATADKEISRLMANTEQHRDSGLLEGYRQQAITLWQQRDELRVMLKEVNDNNGEYCIKVAKCIEGLAKERDDYKQWADRLAEACCAYGTVGTARKGKQYRAFVAKQSQPVESSLYPPLYDWAEALAVEIERMLTPYAIYPLPRTSSLVLQQYRNEHPREPIATPAKSTVTC